MDTKQQSAAAVVKTTIKPMVIDGLKSTQGVIKIENAPNIGVEVTPTGDWHQQGLVEIDAQQIALDLKKGAKTTIQDSDSRLIGGVYGLKLGSDTRLNHQGTLTVKGKEIGIQVPEGSTGAKLVVDSVNAQGEKYGSYVANGQLILNGVSNIKGGQEGLLLRQGADCQALNSIELNGQGGAALSMRGSQLKHQGPNFTAIGKTFGGWITEQSPVELNGKIFFSGETFHGLYAQGSKVSLNGNSTASGFCSGVRLEQKSQLHSAGQAQFSGKKSIEVTDSAFNHSGSKLTLTGDAQVSENGSFTVSGDSLELEKNSTFVVDNATASIQVADFQGNIETKTNGAIKLHANSATINGIKAPEGKIHIDSNYLLLNGEMDIPPKNVTITVHGKIVFGEHLTFTPGSAPLFKGEFTLERLPHAIAALSDTGTAGFDQMDAQSSIINLATVVNPCRTTI